MKHLLSVIIPCYNEHFRFPTGQFEELILKQRDIKLCFVNDGSKDKTQETINALAIKHPSEIHGLQLDINGGKGQAVRTGILYMSTFHPSFFVCYLDADLSAPINEIHRLMHLLRSNEKLECVFGSRISIFGTNIQRLKYRHYGGRIIATMIDLVLRLKIYDTQCGLKIFTSELADTLFTEPFISRWLFDVEIFARLKNMFTSTNLKMIMKEVPLMEWEEKGHSKIKIIDVIRIPFLLLKIHNRYKA